MRRTILMCALLLTTMPAMARAPHHRATPQHQAQPAAAHQPRLDYVPFVLVDPGNAPPMDSDDDEQAAPPDDDSVYTPPVIELDTDEAHYIHAIWAVSPPNANPKSRYT